MKSQARVGAFVLFLSLAYGTAWCEVLVRVSDKRYTHEITEIGGQVWLAMDSGTYRVDRNTPHSLERKLEVATTIVSSVQGEVWIGTTRGVYRVDASGRAVPVLEDERVNSQLFVTAIVETSPEVGLRDRPDTRESGVWIGTLQGLFQVIDRKPVMILREPVHVAKNIGQTLWAGTRSNAFRIKRDGSKEPVLSSDREVSDIVSAGAAVWLITNTAHGHYGRCLRVVADQIEEIPIASGVTSVAEVANDIWLGTTDGIFRYDEGAEPKGPIGGITEYINAISVARGYVWIGTTGGIYRTVDGNAFKAIPEVPLGNVKSFREAVGRVWVGTDKGVYRLDEDVDIRVDLKSIPVFGFELVFGDEIEIEAIRYEREDASAYNGKIDGQFQAIIRFDRQSLDEAVSTNAYMSYQDARRQASAGFREVYIRTKDAFGNTTQGDHITLVVPYAATIFPIIAWWALSLSLLALAPFYSWAMTLIMKPWIRHAGSLLLIHVMLTSSRVRRFLLRNYLDHLSQEEVPPDHSYVSKSAKLKIVKALLEKRKVLLSSASSKFFIQELAWEIAKGRMKGLEGFIPIHLRLLPFTSQEGSISKGAGLLLASKGGIADLDLAEGFLRRGGFAFMLYGVSELNEDRMLVLERFVEIHETNNLIVIGSDSPHQHDAELVDIGFELVEVEIGADRSNRTS